MRITHMGKSIQNLFSVDQVLIGRYLDEIFRLIRPDILLEWNKVRFLFSIRFDSIRFDSISVVELRSSHRFSDGKSNSSSVVETEESSRVEQRGESFGKEISSHNDGNHRQFGHSIERTNEMDSELEHDRLPLSSDVRLFSSSRPRRHLPFSLSSTEDLLNVGLTLHDLNFYDGTSEILIAGMQHARHLQAAIEKVNESSTESLSLSISRSLSQQHAWISKLQSTKLELQEWRRKGKRLLYSMMPRHIAQMLQQGVLPNSICEVFSFDAPSSSAASVF